MLMVTATLGGTSVSPVVMELLGEQIGDVLLLLREKVGGRFTRVKSSGAGRRERRRMMLFPRMCDIITFQSLWIKTEECESWSLTCVWKRECVYVVCIEEERCQRCGRSLGGDGGGGGGSGLIEDCSDMQMRCRHVDVKSSWGYPVRPISEQVIRARRTFRWPAGACEDVVSGAPQETNNPRNRTTRGSSFSFLSSGDRFAGKWKGSWKWKLEVEEG